MLYERKHAWGVLLRLYHWSFALSIVVLAATGLLIHEAWTVAAPEGAGSFPMADLRCVHFLAGFVFIAALLVRFYLLIFGNRQERILDFAPVTPRNLGNFFKTIAAYLYFTRMEHRTGHNALAGTFYILTLVLAVVQAISGLQLLYPESAFWQSLGLFILGTQQDARFIHHLLLWYFSAFAFLHVYIVIWNDLMSPKGLVSSIFTGDKFFPKKA